MTPSSPVRMSTMSRCKFVPFERSRELATIRATLIMNRAEVFDKLWKNRFGL